MGKETLKEFLEYSKVPQEWRNWIGEFLNKEEYLEMDMSDDGDVFFSYYRKRRTFYKTVNSNE